MNEEYDDDLDDFDEEEAEQVCVLWDYRFSRKTERKLLEHRLKIEDAMTVLAQGNFELSPTGSIAAKGKLGKRKKAVVIIRPTKYPQSNAMYDVITAYTI